MFLISHISAIDSAVRVFKNANDVRRVSDVITNEMNSEIRKYK